MPGASLMLVAGAMVLAIAVHWLFRSSRRTLEVATLRIFADRARPRLRLSRLHEPMLLAARLLFLVSIFIALLGNQPSTLERGNAGELTLAIPGTRPAILTALKAEYPDLLWLDGDLSDIGGPPESDRWVSNLLALDQRLPPETIVRVVGELDARAWPIRAPITRRNLVWDVPPAIWADEGLSRLFVVTDSPERESRLRSIIGVWQSYDLLEGTELVWSVPQSTMIDPLIWWSDETPPLRPFGVAVDASDSTAAGGAGWRFVTDTDALNDSEFASTLWRALVRFESNRPPSNSVIEPKSEVIPRAFSEASTAMPSGTPTGGWIWVAVFFMVERLVAAWTLRA